jgi:single-strand DNA-binding protein
MSVAAVTLTGYVAIEPRLWFTKQAQTPVVNLRVGTTPRRMDAATGEWKDGPSSFFTVNCWRKLALNVSASMHRGDPVIIRGQLRMRSWNDNGKTRSTVEIEAESVGHDVAYGFSHFMKGIHPSLLGVRDDSPLGAALSELGATSGRDPGEIPAEGAGSADGRGEPEGAAPAEYGSWADGVTQSGSRGIDEPLDNFAAAAGSTELAAGSGPSNEGGSDDSAGIPDGELASEGVPF